MMKEGAPLGRGLEHQSHFKQSFPRCLWLSPRPDAGEDEHHPALENEEADSPRTRFALDRTAGIVMCITNAHVGPRFQLAWFLGVIAGGEVR